MDSDAPHVSPTDSVEDVIRLMKQHEVPSVAVVGEGGRCVGIVTESDLVLSEEGADLHLPHHIDIMGGVIFVESMKHFEKRVQKAFANSVDEMMTADPMTVDADQPVEAAAKLIAEHKHNRLPVVEHGRYCGVVTRIDVFEALASA